MKNQLQCESWRWENYLSSFDSIDFLSISILPRHIGRTHPCSPHPCGQRQDAPGLMMVIMKVIVIGDQWDTPPCLHTSTWPSDQLWLHDLMTTSRDANWYQQQISVTYWRWAVWFFRYWRSRNSRVIHSSSRTKYKVSVERFLQCSLFSSNLLNFNYLQTSVSVPVSLLMWGTCHVSVWPRPWSGQAGGASRCRCSGPTMLRSRGNLTYSKSYLGSKTIGLCFNQTLECNPIIKLIS